MSVPVVRRLLLPVLAALCAPSAAVAAAPATGGALAEDPPEVSTLECATSDVGACPAGQTLRVRGDNLADARAVVFLGGRGRKDDRRARPTKASAHRLLVKVPGAARSGPLKVLASDASVTGPRLKVLPAAAKAPAADLEPAATTEPADGGVFPIRGKHRFGTGTAAFGGGRGHQGEDVFAACGTPLVAALTGDVTITKWQDRAGNYVVIKADDGTSQAYMHLKAPATWPRATGSRPGTRSARSGTPVTRTAATCTSSCGRRPGGTRAASRSTRCRCSSASTASQPERRRRTVSAACVRLWTPSASRIRDTCLDTVDSEIPSRRAMARLDVPSASRSRTSRSRGVSRPSAGWTRSIMPG